MAEETKSGSWKATKTEDETTRISYFKTKEEAEDWEKSTKQNKTIPGKPKMRFI